MKQHIYIVKQGVQSSPGKVRYKFTIQVGADSIIFNSNAGLSVTSCLCCLPVHVLLMRQLIVTYLLERQTDNLGLPDCCWQCWWWQGLPQNTEASLRHFQLGFHPERSRHPPEKHHIEMITKNLRSLGKGGSRRQDIWTSMWNVRFGCILSLLYTMVVQLYMEELNLVARKKSVVLL